MHTFRIAIAMDNAAFEAPGVELARILRELADRLEDGAEKGRISLHDTNGNHVGEAVIR